MNAQQIPFVIITDSKLDNTISARYSCDDDMIYFYTNDGTFSYGEFLGASVHEMIHYHRDQAGLWTGNLRFEEAIAVYGADKLDSAMGMDNIGSYDFELDAWFLQDIEVNGLPMIPLSADEMTMVEIEIEQTLMYIKTLNAQKQKNRAMQK